MTAAGSTISKTVFLRGGGSIEEIPTLDVTIGFLDVLGVQPRWGRGFTQGDERDPAAFAVILSEGLGRRRFGNPERAVGQRIVATAGPLVVVGVMDRTFAYPNSKYEMWRALDPTGPLTRNFGGVSPSVRINASVPIERVEALVRERSNAIGGAAGLSSYEVTVRPLFGAAPSDRRTFVSVLLCAALCLLLAACASVASVELAGAARRARTSAIQLALGATRSSLAWIAALEGAAIILFAFVIAIGLTWLATDLLVDSMPDSLLRTTSNPIDLDVRAFLGMLIFAAVAWAAATVSPVLAAKRVTLISLLKSEDRAAGASRGAAFIRRVLTASQVAVAVALVIGALLFARTYRNLIGIEKGFDSQRLYSVSWTLPRDFDFAALRQRAVDVLRSAKEVEAVTTSAPPPGTGDSPGPVAMELDGQPPMDAQVFVGRKRVDADFFSVIRLPLKAGRLPQAGDTPDDVVVPQLFARRFFPNGDAVGHVFRTSPREPWQRIIGVVGDFRTSKTRMPQDGDRDLYFYVIPAPPAARPTATPSARSIDTGGSWQVLTLTVLAARGMSTASLQALARQVDPQVPVTVTSVDERYATQASDTRVAANIVSAFGWLAFALAMAGVYGVMTFIVVGRTREIGIRVALGADARNIRSLVLGSSLRMVLLGGALGIAVAFIASGWLQSQLFGVSATDPLIYALAAMAAVTTSVLATWIPARQAAAVDPATTLRSD